MRPNADPSAAAPERLLFQSRDIRIGTFRCPPDHPDFATAGPIEGYTVFFPRSAVWIERENEPAFVADSRVATIYNRGQPYRRRVLGPEGDRGEWFSVERELAVAIATDAFDEVDPERPFAVAIAPSTPRLYYRQRRLIGRLLAGTADRFQVEEEVAALIGLVLRAAPARLPLPRRRETEAARRDLVERARAELARDPMAAPPIRELAARLEVSPYHLCRLFRARTGVTLHGYLLDLKTRLALERLEVPTHGLSRIAHELGFSSHSHLTLTVRSRIGVTPSRIRTDLGAGQRAFGITRG